MAIYQFTVVLLPNHWVSAKNINIDDLFTKEGYDISAAWKQYPPIQHLDSLLTEILPKGKSWHSDLKIWGNQKYSDIQVWYQNGILDDITMRFDLRQNVSGLISKTVTLAIKLNCDFLFPEKRKIIKANISELKEAIRNSDAAKFVKNPRLFLDNLSN